MRICDRKWDIVMALVPYQGVSAVRSASGRPGNTVFYDAYAKTRFLRHHLCLLFGKARLRQITVVLLVLPLCLPILYAPLTKAKTFRNTTLVPLGDFRPDDVIGYLNALIPRHASPVVSASGERL